METKSPEYLDLVNEYLKTEEGIDLGNRIQDLANRRNNDPDNFFSYQDQIKALGDQRTAGYKKYIDDYNSQQSSPPSGPTPGSGDPELNDYADLLNSLQDSKNNTPTTPAQRASVRARGMQERLRGIQEKRRVQRERTATTSSARSTSQQRQQQARELAERLGARRDPVARTGREHVARLREQRAKGIGSNLRAGYGARAARGFTR